MNKQREIIYSLRRNALLSENPGEELFSIVEQAVEAEALNCAISLENTKKDDNGKFDMERFLAFLNNCFPLNFTQEDLTDGLEDGRLVDSAKLTLQVCDKVEAAYLENHSELAEDELHYLERRTILEAIDRLWQEHLYSMDHLRSSMSLRVYAQKDPLVEYKHEAFGIFKAMIDQVYKETAQNLFRLTLKRINEAEQMWENVSPEMFQELFENIDPSTLPMPENEEERQQLLNFLAQMQNNKMAEENANNFAMDNMPEEENAEPLIPYQRESAKIGRNDPCPCGSGKKYKKCCGAN
jgi:preprotein translocase subunit SecA